MNKKYPISVFIIAKNEADRIGFALESVRDWVDEVIVIDSGSVDNTVDLSQKMGARTVFHEWKGYGPQKVYGESLCRNHWILNIDADEAVDVSLRQAIQGLFDKGEFTHKAYHTTIKTMPTHAKAPKRFAPSNSPVRFYDKRYAGFKDSTVHDSVVLKPGMAVTEGKLDGFMAHRCFRSLSHAIEKINFYSSMQADDMVARGKRPAAFRIIVEPFFAFFKAYFLRRYWMLGVTGFVESVVYSFARTLRLAKTREAHLRQEMGY